MDAKGLSEGLDSSGGIFVPPDTPRKRKPVTRNVDTSKEKEAEVLARMAQAVSQAWSGPRGHSYAHELGKALASHAKTVDVETQRP